MARLDAAAHFDPTLILDVTTSHRLSVANREQATAASAVIDREVAVVRARSEFSIIEDRPVLVILMRLLKLGKNFCLIHDHCVGAKVHGFQAVFRNKLCQDLVWKTSYCQPLLPDQGKPGRASARLAVNLLTVRPISAFVTQMNIPDPSFFDRRRRVGWTAMVCVCVAIVGFATEGNECVWAAAAMRIGFVLGALWLCFPTKTRPAAWAVLTRPRLIALVIGALFWSRIKYALPFLAIAGIVFWFIRPRGKRG
jgi:hypothetical protein